MICASLGYSADSHCFLCEHAFIRQQISIIRRAKRRKPVGQRTLGTRVPKLSAYDTILASSYPPPSTTFTLPHPLFMPSRWLSLSTSRIRLTLRCSTICTSLSRSRLREHLLVHPMARCPRHGIRRRRSSSRHRRVSVAASLPAFPQ